MSGPPTYAEMMQTVQVDTPLLIACPKCEGEVVSRRGGMPGMFVCPPPPEIVLCRVCGYVLGTQSRYGPMTKHTEERVHRASAPLRTITEIDRGNDGEGMTLHLQCGHHVRLQRRAYRFSQKRLRCVRCAEAKT